MQESTTNGRRAGLDPMAAGMAQHERLVHWAVRRQWLGDLSYADAVHAGRIGLWRALRRYDPARGTRFSSYAVPAIAHAVWDAVAAAQRLRRGRHLAASGAAPVSADPAEHLDGAAIVAALQELVGGLPPRLCRVVVAHAGLDGTAPASFAAIGQRLGVSRQRAHQLHVQALVWLAHPAQSRTLRRLADRQTRRDYQWALRQQRDAARRRRGATS